MKDLRLLLLLWLCLGGACAFAAPPTTLAYQGRLANAAGQPLTATLTIAFRLYDLPSGGSALWTESQTGILVDGGNFSVELGRTVALPRSLFGRQLYLGVQVAGDAEMSPRPPLTASPYALRAAGTLARTLEVPADGSAAENGAALLAAIAGLPAAAAAFEGYRVQLDAGDYDLGTARLNLPAFATLAGQGLEATRIRSTNERGTVLLASNCTIRDLSAENTGVPPTVDDYAFAISAEGPLFDASVVSGVTIERVAATSRAATGSTGARWALRFCAVDSHLRDSRAIAQGGTTALALRADCAGSRDTFLDNLTLAADGASDNLRGAYFAGGGIWKDIKVFIEPTASALSVFGVRTFANTANVSARLEGVRIVVLGDGVVATNSNSRWDGLRTDGGEVQVSDLYVNLDRVQVQNASGVRITALAAGVAPVSLSGVEVRVDGVQRAALGFGMYVGIDMWNAAPTIRNARVRVDCRAGATYLCVGLRRSTQTPGTLDPRAVEITAVDVEVGHEDPVDAAAGSQASATEGSVIIRDSQLRVRQSADLEPAVVVATMGNAADLRVQGSALEHLAGAAPGNGCWYSANSGTGEFTGNVLRGLPCISAPAVLTCAGNTRRGVGFLASGCQ